MRIMISEMRRERHREMVNFERQVGSSFDPDVEDLADWEGDIEDGIGMSISGRLSYTELT